MLDPKTVLSAFHEKVFFKAATEIQLNQGNLKVTNTVDNDKFINIMEKFKSMRSKQVTKTQ